MGITAARLRQLAPREEVDYLFLQGALALEYSGVRDKITQLLASGSLVRVKKGLYVFGPEVAREPYRVETLANLIFGPSYLSLEWALAHYGLIPERPVEITSVTSKRDRIFDTPVGRFSYRYLHPDKYPVGVDVIELDTRHPVLMATREKALADKVALRNRRGFLRGASDVEAYLERDLRFDFDELVHFDRERVSEVAATYRNSDVDTLADYLLEVLK